MVEITPKDRKRFRKLLEEGHDFASLPIRTRLNDAGGGASSRPTSYRFPGVDISARLFRHYPERRGGLARGRLHRPPRRKATSTSSTTKAWRRTTPARTSSARSDWRGATRRELHGITGFEEVETDANGRAVRTLRSTLPVSGNNLLLSLDARLQEVAERVFGDRRGALVAIEPSTGGVLALVSKPGFDPNLFVDGIDPQNWERSTIRPTIRSTTARCRGCIRRARPSSRSWRWRRSSWASAIPHHTISDPGYFVLGGAGGHAYRDWKAGGHGMVDLHKSIVVSCDTYYYGLAQELGIDNIHELHRPVRLRVRRPASTSTARRRAAAFAGLEDASAFQQKWFAGDTISVGIGQGYNLATPMQLAFATSILANNGVVFRPHIVRHIQDSQTNELTSIEVEPRRHSTA